MSTEVSRVRDRPARAARRLSSCVASVFMTPWPRPKAWPDDGSFAPTRSTRTPLVTKPRRHRLETPMPHGRPPRRAGTIDRDDPVAQALLSRPARKRGARVAPRTTRSREAGRPTEHNTAICLRRPRGLHRHGRLMHACADTATRGPRAASPDFPRRRSGSAAPEVPSIDEPPGFRPKAFALHRPVGRTLSTGCHQPVDNTRRP
jgi:hypothetical protein